MHHRIVPLMTAALLLPISSRHVSARAAEIAAVSFPKGTLTLQTGIAYAKGLEARRENIASGNVGFGYFVFDNLSLNLEFSGYRAIQDGEDAWAGGISAALHHHLIRFDRYTIFGDVDFGPIIATEQIPADGTQFNFITRVGAGFSAQLTDDMHLLLGARYFHLSNARIDGADRNPSINGIEGYLELMWVLH